MRARLHGTRRGRIAEMIFIMLADPSDIGSFHELKFQHMLERRSPNPQRRRDSRQKTLLDVPLACTQS
jgi:hypothetical protein